MEHTKINSALRITLTYALIAGLWILFSDRLLEFLISDTQTLTNISTIKGLGFVLVTSTMLYALIHRDVQIQQKAYQALGESEEKFRLIFEESSDANFILDGEILQECNLAAVRLYGVENKFSLIGRKGTDFTTEYQPDGISSTQKAREMIENALQTGRSNFIWDILNQSGAPLTTQVDLTPIKIAGKTCIFAVMRDITRQRLAEEEIKNLNNKLEERVQTRTAQLEAANAELEAFSFSVSHDLRAPLRAIDGFSRALMDDYKDRLDDSGQHFLQRLVDSSQKMAELIDDLLMLSRITRGNLTLTQIDLSAMAKNILDELGRTQPNREVEVIVAPGLAGYGDVNMINIALQNLLTNAWKFTSKISNAKIEFNAEPGNGSQTIYFVRDNGAGFDMAYSEKLFGAFQRLHSVNEFEGNGIGLATVKRIIHRHEGKIWAEGKVDQGATFYFTLPGEVIRN